MSVAISGLAMSGLAACSQSDTAEADAGVAAETGGSEATGGQSGSPAIGNPGTSTDMDEDDSGVAAPPFSVDSDSESCDVSLPFHPPGCACELGETAKCWTGPPGFQGLPGCADGVQECTGGEFGAWTACHDEDLACIDDYPEIEDPPGEECGCVPGATITCSEDCSEFIICSLTGTKVCQPDGSWSACREFDFDALSVALPCRGMFFGCLPNNSPGVFVGDCNSAFTCGEVPPALTLPPDTEVPGSPVSPVPE